MRSASTVLLLFAASAVARAADRPNILLICVDDLKPLLGCYGDETVQTPNIDRLAKRGVRFDRAYCNQAVCAPSRNSLLTGLRPQSIGVYDLGTFFRRAVPDAITLPQYFKQHGYRTEGLGKIYHVGHGNQDDAASWSMPFWRPQAEKYHLPESRPPSGDVETEASLRPRARRGRNGRPRKIRRGAAYEAADVPDNAYPDGQIADEAIRRLQRAAESPDQPFFLAVGFMKPHLPFCAPRKYWDLYDRNSFSLAQPQSSPAGAPDFAPTDWRELRNYLGIPQTGPLDDELQRTLIHGYHAAVSYTDAQIGRVLEALEQAGLDDNTIVVLWGDHGWHLGDHGMWCKHTNYEHAARIPLIVAAPGVSQPGGAVRGLVESVDVYPTLCALAGLPAPGNLDGVPFDAALRDPTAPTKPAVFHAYPRGERLGRALRTDRYRLVEWKVPGRAPESAMLELYDYQSDPLETRNLAADHPEITDQLQAMLNELPEAKPQIPPATSPESSKSPVLAR